MSAGFQDKVVVITGGASGIGYATAKLFSAQGAVVIINDIRGDAAEKAVLDIIKACGRALASQGDIADPEQVRESAREFIAQFGRIDILINDAALPIAAPAAEYTEFSRSMSVNLGGAFNWSQAVAVESMIPNKSGSIVNVSSLAGLAAVPGDVGYVVTKHGLIGLTKALALEWAVYGIRVNAIAPGVTDSPMMQEAAEKYPDFIKERIGRIPMRRIGQPEDQTKAILFLASEDAAYIIWRHFTC